MTSIFAGFIFIFLDFNLNLDNSTIELIPDFIGYLIMLGGLRVMAGESPAFAKVRPHAVFMAFYTGIVWLLEVFGVTVSLGALSFLLGIASLVISLYISYTIIIGVRDMESRYGTHLNSDSLKTAWNLLTVSTILAYLLLLLVPVLSVLCIIVSLIAAIWFLAAFYRSKTLYCNMRI
jgi:hypothetical protein